jgi:hypothetical protein
VNSGGGRGGVGGLGGWSEWPVHVAALGGQGIERRPSLQRLLELWLEDGLAQGGRRRTSDAVASGLGKAMMVSHRRQVQRWQRRMVRRAGARWELKEKKRGSSSVGRSSYSCTRRCRGRRKRWVGTTVETAAKQWVDKAAAAVQMRSAWRHRCLDHVADERGPRGFVFS